VLEPAPGVTPTLPAPLPEIELPEVVPLPVGKLPELIGPDVEPKPVAPGVIVPIVDPLPLAEPGLMLLDVDPEPTAPAPVPELVPGVTIPGIDSLPVTEPPGLIVPGIDPEPVPDVDPVVEPVAPLIEMSAGPGITLGGTVLELAAGGVVCAKALTARTVPAAKAVAAKGLRVAISCSFEVGNGSCANDCTISALQTSFLIAQSWATRSTMQHQRYEGGARRPTRQRSRPVTSVHWSLNSHGPPVSRPMGRPSSAGFTSSRPRDAWPRFRRKRLRDTSATRVGHPPGARRQLLAASFSAPRLGQALQPRELGRYPLLRFPL
jgi:hypothetical protein